MTTPTKTTTTRQLKLRTPADTHDALAKAAARSGRSLNAEIVRRLEQTFIYDNLEAELQRMNEELAMMRRNVDAVAEQYQHKRAELIGLDRKAAERVARIHEMDEQWKRLDRRIRESGGPATPGAFPPDGELLLRRMQGQLDKILKKLEE